MDEPLDQDTGSIPEHGPEERTVGGFRILRPLGRGGFGEVYLGEDEAGRLAAVKVLHASWAGDTEMRRRFATEVDQARRVSGFCIASILDADPDADEPWIATEYIDGPTLQDSVTKEGPRSG
ncbi:protein kinase domain-containing protein, partial [Nocardiopsis kunsanensis]